MVEILVRFAKFSSADLCSGLITSEKSRDESLKTRLHDSSPISFLLRNGTSCTAGKYIEPWCICAMISITIFRDDPDLLKVS